MLNWKTGSLPVGVLPFRYRRPLFQEPQGAGELFRGLWPSPGVVKAPPDGGTTLVRIRKCAGSKPHTLPCPDHLATTGKEAVPCYSSANLAHPLTIHAPLGSLAYVFYPPPVGFGILSAISAPRAGQ